MCTSIKAFINLLTNHQIIMTGMEYQFNKEMSVLNYLRSISPEGNFISEFTILNHFRMKNFHFNQFEIQNILLQLCNRNLLEMIIPFNQAAACATCGPCSGGCGGSCAQCCGGGRYYRVKIGGLN